MRRRTFHRLFRSVALAALVVAFLGHAPEAAAERTRVGAEAAVDPLRHLHRGVTGFARVELDELRSFRHFRALVRHGAEQMHASTRDANRIRALLERTETVYIATVEGPGRTAELASVLLHGSYGPGEVPRAVQSILPGLLQGLWAETVIDGKPAYDIGVAALVRLSDRDWLLARRIGGELPVTPRQPPPAVASAAFARLGQVAGLGEGAASGVLLAADRPDTALSPPEGLGLLYHRTRSARGRLELGASTTARFAFEMRSPAAAAWREAQLRDLLDRAAASVGEAGAEPFRYELSRSDDEVAVTVSLDPTQLDAYVARFLAGRLLSGAPAAERPTASNDRREEGEP